MNWFLPALQGAVFASLIARWYGGDEMLRYMLWGAVAFPLASLIVGKLFPRFGYVLAIILVAFWTGTCGYGAYLEPGLEAWEWIPFFAVLGFFWGATANLPLMLGVQKLADDTHREPTEQPSHFEGPARPREHMEHGSSRASENPSASDPPPPDPSPWEILGVEPGAPQITIKEAFYARMQEYHPDKVAALGPELRDLAEAKAKAITKAYESVRRDRTP